jgi:hypothetical protein
MLGLSSRHHSKLSSKRFKTPASLTWCAKSSPDELLQRQNLVSVTRFACVQLRLLGREANESSLPFVCAD